MAEMDFVVALNIAGQLHEQIKNLPPGTRISGIVLPVVILVAYYVLTVKTSQIAGRMGRSRENWLLYAAVAPVISFIHVIVLYRRSRRQNGSER